MKRGAAGAGTNEARGQVLCKLTQGEAYGEWGRVYTEQFAHPNMGGLAATSPWPPKSRPERQKQDGSETPRNSHPDTFRPKPEHCADVETGRSGGLIQSRFGGSSETSLCLSPAPDLHTPALWSAFHSAL